MLVAGNKNSVTRKWSHVVHLVCCWLFCFHAGAQPRRPPLTGIAFVELQVSDIKKSTGFYTGLLGYRAMAASPAKNGEQLNFAVNTMQSVRINAGLQPGHDERLLSIAFHTTDAEGMRLYLGSKGVVVPPAIKKEPTGDQWFGVTDPDRHFIKFVQYKPVKAILVSNSQHGISASILHAGITVADTAAANAFYRDILGFSETWRGGANDSVTNWINMHVPESTAYIEYMFINRPADRQQLGNLHHIALMVPDMQEALNILYPRAARIGYPMASPRVGRNKRWQLNLFDPDGTRIELMEPFTMR